MKRASLVLLVAGLVACAGTATKTNDLSVGMTKAQVVETLGQPYSSRATNGVEYLTYKLTPGTTPGQGAGCAAMGVLTLGMVFALGGPCTGGKEEDYFVQIQNGQVVSYGKVGDFDSTKTPTINVNKSILYR